MYKNIIIGELPAYLKEKKKKNDRTLIARFRRGNKIKDGQHWRDYNDKICTICQKKEESFKYIKLMRGHKRTAGANDKRIPKRRNEADEKDKRRKDEWSGEVHGRGET